MTSDAPGEGQLISLSPAMGGSVHPLDPSQDDAAAEILAPATGEGTVAAGRARVDEARTDPDQEIYGLTVKGELVAAYVTRKIPMALEVKTLAVAAGHRRHGYGRACLTDALRRAGKRPLVVETDDEALGFYKKCGFKVVSRHKHPSGVLRYRLGWHAPGLRFKGGSTGTIARQLEDVERGTSQDQDSSGDQQ